MSTSKPRTDAEALLANGDWQGAVALLGPIAQSHGDAELWNTLGTAYAKGADDDRALAAYQTSAQLDPHSHKPHANMATVLGRRADHAGAHRALVEATRIAPTNVKLQLRLAKASELAGRHEDEAAAYERVVALDPIRLHRNLLARALIKSRKFDDALRALGDAGDEDDDALMLSMLAKLGQRPRQGLEDTLLRVLDRVSAPHLLELAEVARKGEAFAVAEELGRRVLAIEPSDQKARRCTALAISAQGHPDRAADLIEELGLAEANDGLLRTWIGLAIQGVKELQSPRLHRGLAARPEDPVILLGLAMAAAEHDDAQALGYLDRVLAVAPEDAAAYREIGAVWAQRGAMESARTFLRRAEELDSGEPPSVTWFVGLHDGSTSPGDLFEATRASMLEHEFAAQLPRTLDSTENRRLRIGYVSGDLRSHAVEKFVRPLLTQYDRDRFEVFGYRTTNAADATTERLSAHITMRVLAGCDRDAGAQLIADDRIDVLVDLGGHTNHSGLTYFSRRPAPIQISLLGYPATTGLSAMDLRLTDAYADPLGLTDPLHTERLVRVHPCAWSFAERAPSPTARPPGAPIVFGSFNRAMKISSELLDAWARILLATPDARLYLKGRSFWSEHARARIFDRMRAHGVERERILIVGWTATYEAHQVTWHNIDIALDAFPYAGTTTTCEALMMGVPVVSRVGGAHVSRVGASLLAAIGLEDLVAQDWDGYVSRAIALANDAPLRATLRRELPARFATSALGDPRPFVQGVERAYLEAWSSFLGSPDAKLYGRATRIEQSPMTWAAHPASVETGRTLRRAATGDPAIRALRALALQGETLTTDLPERVDDLRALSSARVVELVGDHEEFVVECLRANLAPAAITTGPAATGSLLIGSEALVRARADDPELLAIVVGARGTLPPLAVGARVLPELDVLEELDRGSPVRPDVVLGPSRAASLRVRGVLSVGGSAVTGQMDDARAREVFGHWLAHLAWWGAAAPVPPSVGTYLSALSAPLGERVARARIARKEAARELAEDPSSFAALNCARVALGSGEFALAKDALREAIAHASRATAPRVAFLCAHPRYELACLPEGATPFGWARPPEPAMTIFAGDPIWPERIEAQAARASVDSRLTVAAVPRWIVQQAAECLLLFCKLASDEREQLLTTYRRHGGRSLAISRVAAAHRLAL